MPVARTNRQLRRVVGGALFVSAALLLASASGTLAQTPAVPVQLLGTWSLDGGTARAVETVDAAFGPSVRALPSLIQGMARDRIRSDMSPPQRVVVSSEGAIVRVNIEAMRTMIVRGRLGAPATTSGVDDGTRVTPNLAGGWLELLFEGEGSQMRQLFSTEADGSRMHLDYTVVNPRLSGPVRYRLDYVPAGAR